MKLRYALLCLDCDEVFEARWDGCPDCTSKHSHPISSWLNREHESTCMSHVGRRCSCSPEIVEPFAANLFYAVPDFPPGSDD